MSTGGGINTRLSERVRSPSPRSTTRGSADVCCEVSTSCRTGEVISGGGGGGGIRRRDGPPMEESPASTPTGRGVTAADSLYAGAATLLWCEWLRAESFSSCPCNPGLIDRVGGGGGGRRAVDIGATRCGSGLRSGVVCR
jgi:hypothetical protein